MIPERVTGDWLSHPATQAVCKAFEEAGHTAYFVGGCVRNALMGEPVSDIDISTNAVPMVTMEIAQAAGFHAIPTGIDHGTITVVAKGIAHEITTYRKDVATDGRRAVVAFAETIEQDALRRDFTMNALYADRHGDVLDPLGGFGDLEQRRVRFIQDAHKRIQEDYLRTLRFFRFNAWYGDAEHGLDEDALDAIAQNLDGLERLSKERVTAEILKLLSAPDPAPSLAAMRATGVLARVLPSASDRNFALLVHHEQHLGLDPNPIRRLASLCPSIGQDDLRLSNAERKRFDLLVDGQSNTMPPHELGYRLGLEPALDVLVLRATLFETEVPHGGVLDVELGAKANFPIAARDLMPHYSGPDLGNKMRELEGQWITSKFTLGKDDLL